MRARVNQAVWEANWAFTDSGVAVQINPVHVDKIDYDHDALPPDDTLDILTKPNQIGIDAETLDSVHALRTTFNADIVVLIIEKLGNAGASTTGGTSNQMTGLNMGAFESQAFAVVLRIRQLLLRP